jgi:hypothetical protein
MQDALTAHAAAEDRLLDDVLEAGEELHATAQGLYAGCSARRRWIRSLAILTAAEASAA